VFPSIARFTRASSNWLNGSSALERIDSSRAMNDFVVQ
jgi:hypothetical protein